MFRKTVSGRPSRSPLRSRVARQSGDRCGGAIDRAILHPREEVAVTAAWALRKLQAADAFEPMLARAEELQRLTLEKMPVTFGDR